MNEQFWWYVSRSAGIAAWALALASVLWGIALATRALGPNPKAPWLLDLHRHLGGLTVLFTGIHMGALVADNYLHFGRADLLVPFASGWKTGAVAWGVVAFWLLVGIEATSLFMKRIPKVWWRRIHLTSYAVAGMTTIHLFTAGTDATTNVLRWTTLAAGSVIAFFLLYRQLGPKKANRIPGTVRARVPPGRLTPTPRFWVLPSVVHDRGQYPERGRGGGRSLLRWPACPPHRISPTAVAGALGDHGWSQLDVGALGTAVRLAVRGGGPALLIDARQLLDDLDRKWNPARPDSLVAQLEGAGGAAVPLDDDTYTLVEASVAAADATGGAVGSEGLVLNAVLTRVAVPEGAVLDVDDLARAQAADLVAEALVEAGAEGAVVDVGGALRLAGTVGDGRAWVVEIPDPDGPASAELGLAEGAAVTIERPTSELVSVTVLAPDAATAAVFAAAADEAGIVASGHPALLVDADGTHRRLGGVEAYLRRG